MVEFMMDTIKMIENMESVYLNGQMEDRYKENGEMANRL